LRARAYETSRNRVRVGRTKIARRFIAGIIGKTFEITKGDLVVVPRGTPHQRSTANKDFTMILIKNHAEPLKPGAPKPTSLSQKP
jgi:uncharacterized protein YjlB